MKDLILIKTSNQPVLAHFYEHLYCRALTRFLREHGLIRQVDYDYEARSYPGAFVYLDCQFLTKPAVDLTSDIAKLELPLDEDSLDLCTRQLSAEGRYRLGGKDRNQILDGLKALHRQPWADINTFGAHDARGIRRDERKFWHGDRKPHLFRTLRCDLVLDPPVAVQDRQLLPLFYLLSEILSTNISDELVEGYGYYADGGSFRYAGKTAKETFFLRIDRDALAPSLAEEADSCRSEIARLFELGLIKKWVSYLRSATYTATSRAPDALAVYEATGLFVGIDGWHEIATEENVVRLLGNTTLTLKLGRLEEAISLGDYRV